MEFLALAAVLLGVIVLQNWLFQHKALEHLEYRCYLTADQVFEGDEIELVEELANKKWLPIPQLKTLLGDEISIQELHHLHLEMPRNQLM